MSKRQQIIKLLQEFGPMTQREIADQLDMGVDLVRGYIGALRQRKPGVLYIHSYRRDEDGGRLYPRALWAAGRRKDAERLPRLTKPEYNKRGKDKMRRRPASIFHVAGLANATNAVMQSFNQKFQGPHEVHEVRAREVDRARNQG